jgi:hypothetical protein
MIESPQLFFAHRLLLIQKSTKGIYSVDGMYASFVIDLGIAVPSCL